MSAVHSLVAGMGRTGALLAQQGYGRDWDNWGMHPMMSWGFGWLGAVVMLIFWLVFIVAGVMVVRWLWNAGHSGQRWGGGPGAGDAQDDRALHALRERYARGEISRDEFLAMKKDLTD